MFSSIVIATALSMHFGPIPKSNEEVRKTVETAWNDLVQSPNPRARRKAYLTLHRYPKETTALLAAKLRPLELSEATALEKLKDLESPDPAVWKKAVEFLTEFDIRLAMDLKTAFEKCPSRLAMQRLAACVLEVSTEECENHYFDVIYQASLAVIKTGYTNMNGFVQIHHNHSLYAKDIHKKVWLGRTIAIPMLHSFRTNEANALLEKLAQPKVKTMPTTLAGQKSGFEKLELKTPLIFDFQVFGIWGNEETYRIMLEYFRRPTETMTAIRATMPPIRLNQERAIQLMKELDSDDNAISEAAFTSWKALDLLLITDDVEFWLRKHGSKRAIERYWAAQVNSREIDALKDRPIEYEKSDTADLVRIFYQKYSSHVFQYDRKSRDRISHQRWFRIAVAIDLLEAWDTKESLAILNGLAAGHPRAEPTQDARAALKRLNQPLPPIQTEP